MEQESKVKFQRGDLASIGCRKEGSVRKPLLAVVVGIDGYEVKCRCFLNGKIYYCDPRQIVKVSK